MVGKLFPLKTQLYPGWRWGETEGKKASVERNFPTMSRNITQRINIV